MSDDALMSSADAAAAASATEAIIRAIEAKYECVDGPPTASFEFTIGKDGGAPRPDERWETVWMGYVMLQLGAQIGNSVDVAGFGFRSLGAVVEAFPDFVDQSLENHNLSQRYLDNPRVLDNCPTLAIDPGQERLVWRRKPAVLLRCGRWYCSCRLGFMPKTGVLLPMEERAC